MPINLRKNPFCGLLQDFHHSIWKPPQNPFDECPLVFTEIWVEDHAATDQNLAPDSQEAIWQTCSMTAQLYRP